MIPFYLITGFLGSGKTTLLKHILQNFKDKKIAVIQNEFAPTGVDGKELRLANPEFKLVEINNGSVFCVCQLNNFIETLTKVCDDYQPEIIFLEASGLADPISIAELIQTESIRKRVALGQIITLIDAPNYFRGLQAITRFKHQLLIADKVVLNKTDVFDGDVQEIKDSILSFNPLAKIETTTFAQIDLASLKSNESNNESAIKQLGKESDGRPTEMNSCVLRSHDKICKENLAFLDKMSDECIRIKGFVNTCGGKAILFHTVFEQVEMNEIEGYAGPTEIIAFGKDLTVQHLRKTFKASIIGNGD